MKKLLYLCTTLCLVTGNLWAQDEDNMQGSALAPSQEIWAPKQKKSTDNVFSDNNSATSKRPAPPNTNVTNTPIDGGLLILLGAGVLYGSKRVMRKKVANT